MQPQNTGIKLLEAKTIWASVTILNLSLQLRPAGLRMTRFMRQLSSISHRHSLFVRVWRPERRKPHRWRRNVYYKIDNGIHRPQLGPGFLGFLHKTRFWKSVSPVDNVPDLLRRYLLRMVAVAAVVFIGWIIYESIRALSLF